MHQTLKRAAVKRVVIAEHRSGFGGQCRLASAAISLPLLRKAERESPDAFTPEVVRRWHADACQARRQLRRQIRTHKLGPAAL